MSGRGLSDERPPSLLTRPPVSPGMIVAGIGFTLGAHLLVPLAMMASQWLLIALGLAIASSERERPMLPPHTIAAEFVQLGKPFDPTKLPNRKVPPVAKRTPDGVVVSKDAQETEPKPEDKKRPPDAQDSLLDNLVDRTKDFAEDVPYEPEGDPQGIAEGTATSAKAGNLYLGQLTVFFQRPWSVPNVVQNAETRKAFVSVQIAADGRLLRCELNRSSGDPLFDQSAVDAVQSLIDADAILPEPPADLRDAYYGTTIAINFDGRNMRR